MEHSQFQAWLQESAAAQEFIWCRPSFLPQIKFRQASQSVGVAGEGGASGDATTISAPSGRRWPRATPARRLTAGVFLSLVIRDGRDDHCGSEVNNISEPKGRQLNRGGRGMRAIWTNRVVTAPHLTLCRHHSAARRRRRCILWRASELPAGLGHNPYQFLASAIPCQLRFQLQPCIYHLLRSWRFPTYLQPTEYKHRALREWDC